MTCSTIDPSLTSTETSTGPGACRTTFPSSSPKTEFGLIDEVSVSADTLQKLHELRASVDSGACIVESEAPGRRLSYADRQDCDVVAHLTGEARPRYQFGRRRARGEQPAGNNFTQSAFADLPLALRFNETVGEEHENIPVVELEPAARIARGEFAQSKWQTACFELLQGAAAAQDRQRMPGVSEADAAPVRADDGDKRRHDCIGVTFAEKPFGRVENFRRIGLVKRRHPHPMPNLAHDRGSLNAASGYVADAYDDGLVVELDGIVPIAPDRGFVARRRIDGIETQTLRLGNERRERRLLKRGGNLALALERQGTLHRDRGAGGDLLKQRDVAWIEWTA